MDIDDLMENNPFEDNILYAKCQALLDRSQTLVIDEGDKMDRVVTNNMPFLMACTKLSVSGMTMPRGGQLMALVALIIAMLENDGNDDVARKLLDYDDDDCCDDHNG